MAQQKLDNRPGQVYDPESAGAQSHPESLEKRNSPKDEAAFDQIAADNRDIGSAERNASANDGQNTEVNGNEPVASDTVGKGYSGDKNAKSGSGMSGKKKKGILAAVTLSATGLVVGIFMAMPGFMINQIREVMTGKIGDLQTRQSLKYRRAKLSKISDVFSRDGRLGGGVITEMETRGYRFSYSLTDRNAVVGITLPGGDISLRGEAVGAHISDYMEVKHPWKTSRWKTKRMNALYDRFKISRASIIRAGPDDPDDPFKTINKNLAQVIDGEDLDTAADAPRLPDEATEADRIAANESSDFAENNNAYQELREATKVDGVDIYEADPELAKVFEGVADGLDPSLNDALNALGDTGSIAGKALDGVKSLGTTDLADKVCTVKKRLRLVTIAARTKRAVEQMRIAGAFIGAADATRNGQANSKLLSAVLRRTTELDRNGNPIGASPGFSYALKKKFSKSRNDSTRSNIDVGGKLTGVLAAVQDSTDAIPGTTPGACSIWQNPITQIADGILQIAVAIFSGGSAPTITTAFKAGAVKAVKEAVQSSINKTVAKSLLKSVAFQVATELSFEGILALTQMYAEKSMTYNYSGQETGADLGDILTSGAGSLNKQRSLQSGMVPATAEQYAAAQNEYLETIAEERSNQSVFARYLDLNNVDSLASNTLFQTPKSTEHMAKAASGGLASIFSTPSTIMSTVTNQFMPKTFAQDSDEIAFDTFVTEGNNSGIPLATDHAGNLLPIMRTDIEAIDPIENIEVLKSSADGGPFIDASSLEPIGRFKEHVETCVEPVDTISTIEATPAGDLNDGNEKNDCLATLRLTVRFKAHLAYIDMMDAVEAEFLPGSIEETPTQTSAINSPTTSLSAPGLNGYAVPCQGDPRVVIRNGPSNGPYAIWDGIPTSGTIGTNSGGQPINVYIREACDTTNVKTVFIGASIHGSENGGQFVAHELLFNAQLPSNIRIVAIPEINGSAIRLTRRTNANGVDLNRNNDYNWASIPTSTGTDRYKGTAPASEPETKAVNDFLVSLGRINLAIYYHDNIHYVAAVGNTTPLSYASTYASFTPDSPLRRAENGRVFQRGSFDAWHNQRTGTPTLLIELSSLQDAPTIQGHVNGVKALAELGEL